MKRIYRISVTHIAGILYVVCKLTEGYISGSKVSQAVHIVTTVSTSDQYADHAFMVETCDSVRDRCVSDPSCEMLLHSIKTFCANVVTGESSTCTEQCSRALFKMAMRAYSDFALDFVNCDCNGSFTCQSMKGLIETCTKSVVTLIKGAQSGYAYSCRLGWWICAQDPECELARITSELECRTMLDGIECTSSCNSSIGHLFRQPSAVVLSNCVCDGVDRLPCISFLSKMYNLCYNYLANLKMVSGPVSNTTTAYTSGNGHMIPILVLLILSNLLCLGLRV